MKKAALPLLALVLFAFLSEPLFAQEEDGESSKQSVDQIRVVLRLNQATLATLKNKKFIKASVNKDKNTKVVSIKLIPTSPFSDEPLPVTLPTKQDGDALEVVIDDNHLMKLGYQPLILDVNQRGFTKLILKYEPGENAVPFARERTNQKYIRLQEGKNGIFATLQGNLELKTSFGKHSIPWDQIEAVKFESTLPSQLILTNGDRIRGRVSVPSLSLITDWGPKEFTPEQLFSVTKSAQHRFLRNKVEGENVVNYVYYNMQRRR